MAEKILSPGVFTNEIDQSFLPATAGPIGAAIVGPTVKGPVLIPTVVNSYSEYVQIFGELIESGSDNYQYLTSHTAKEYLRQGGPATVIRVADPDGISTKASATVAAAGTPVTATKAFASFVFTNVPSGSAGTLSGNAPDTFAIGDVTYAFVSSSLGLSNSSTQVFIDFPDALNLATTTTTVAQNTVNAINNNEGNGTTSLGISASFAAAVLSITSSADGGTNYAITSGSVTAGEGVSKAPFLGELLLRNDGTAGMTGGAVASVSGQNLFTIEVLGNGNTFNNTSTLGTDQVLLPQTSSIGNNLFSSGSYGGRSDNFRYEISQKNLKKGTFTLALRQGNDSITSKKVIETFDNISLDPGESNYILKRIGNTTNVISVEDGQAFIQPTGEFPNKSKNIRISEVLVNTPNYLKEDGTVDSNAYPNSASVVPAVGSGSAGGSFDGGDFGQEIEHPFNFYDEIAASNSQGVDMSESAALVTTSAVGGGYMTALNLLKNKDEFDINILYLPGVIDQLDDHSTVIGEAIQVCEDRGDCFLVYDNVSKTSTVATAKTNTEARNSSYAAVYYPWVQIQDATTGNFRFVPPSVVISGVYHFNDTVGQPWFAPAGLNRGGIDSAVQAYKKLTQKNRDDLYDSNTNPIATFPGQGVTVFGQKTTQKKASALDRVNVRRLLINLKKFVANSSRNLVFEQNTSDLRNQFLNIVNPYMEQVQANSGLNAFRVVMDDSNNTPETIDRNLLIGQIFVQPSRTAEFIVLDFVVQPTGAAFPE